jgi:hypothetical protein
MWSSFFWLLLASSGFFWLLLGARSRRIETSLFFSRRKISGHLLSREHLLLTPVLAKAISGKAGI